MRERPPRAPKPRSRAKEPAYPEQETSDRRTFLRQVVGGGVALGLAGAWRDAAADEPPVEPVVGGPDFSVLDEHEGVELAVAPAAAKPAPRRERAKAARGATEAEEPAVVTEQRVLDLEPGYTLLIDWTRPTGTDAPVVALEGARSDLAALLASELDEAARHEAEKVAQTEMHVLAVLAPRIVPAFVNKLHLDHDCATMCPSKRPQVRGRIKRVR